ncbi:efflux transporter outer membrane subunit [Paraburkholderia phymatum]|uniref:RND efflux system, outer membrane lipoprotein, NodT family n=1 Tax=Paraburkholderia phymatum (strain DSM 17167 / CIP 108236 / LMG 21445 / STM815) TaxID=391038 RepID=B2JQA1_PARP8|nr:efflux transporter outer membrane subunit [Paraburkholderia phymatum]ACC73442.1 RND efflux system, outer membrane lipoprotein, NodT family [Paraburkholderia phymatum STM815]
MKRYVPLFALALCGCAVGPDFHAPAPPDAPSYMRETLPATTQAAGAAQTLASSDHALPTWWTQFQSDALNRLVDTALQHSPTLDEARAKLVQARENYVAQAGATQFPAIDATLSGSRQKVDPAAFGIPNVQNPGPFTLFNASVSVSYALDVFGGNRRALEALLAQVDYQTYELQAARLTLAGNVVSAVIRRASLQQQLALTRQLANAQARQLTIVEGRYAAGGVAQLDVRTQHTLLAQTRAQIPPLETQLAQADHQLAILLGIVPSQANFDDITLDALHLPDAVPVTLPSTLARERPDIRASEALLHQASADVGVATANLYPQFIVSAGFGSERTRIEDVVNGLNVWNIGLNLAQPIFHGGELRAKKRAAQAAYDAAFASYRQTVLKALQQVADTLHALNDDAHALQARDDANAEAQASAKIAQAQYAAGGVSQFGLIDTQRQALQTALDRTRAQADRLVDTAALFQALGGMTASEQADQTAGR